MIGMNGSKGKLSITIKKENNRGSGRAGGALQQLSKSIFVPELKLNHSKCCFYIGRCIVHKSSHSSQCRITPTHRDMNSVLHKTFCKRVRFTEAIF